MLKIFAVAIISLASYAGSITAHSDNNPNEEKLIKRLNVFTEKLNSGNADNLGEFWTKEAEIVNPVTGESVIGKSNVEAYLKKKAQELKGKNISFDLTHVEYPDEDSAIVEGTLQLFENGKLIDRRARKIGLIYVDGTWYLDVMREIQVDQAPSSYEQLKGLEWLIGTWKDVDEDVSIEFKTQWDKNKNFLVQKFGMNVYGLDELGGMEIIGWDPVERKIRSWIFDSDGGFGSGIWTKENDTWVVKVNYTLSNGKAASDTDIFSNITDKSYTYSTIDRKEDGVSLPNIEPVNVLKGE